MTNSGNGSKKWYFVLGGIIASLVAFLNGVFDLGDHIFGDSSADAEAPAASSAAPGTAVASSSVVSSAQPDEPVASTKPISAGTVEQQPETSPASHARRSGPAWYNLTAYKAVSFGNGHSSVPSITIGNSSFPNSIKGYYQSSASDPNDRRTWLTAGSCDQLSVWVGKDAASSGKGGTGHFSVQAEAAEIAGADATLQDPPQQLVVNIAGVSRLTLFDTKASQDANNAWGSPKVRCTAPPGEPH
ncbi:NPCBM/NEW2 domain-containing protein [Amycolatopsis sp. NPDC048633]|uniref:NPCBM/NEW2 domain-containing protein n=1 Tax=Amycolatopsis sp. NPDC048633 TaxID=3157095 RepID=UPI0033C05EDF